MASADETTEALRKEVSELKAQLKELDEENVDLREICAESGIPWEERLGIRRHKRYFARLCAEHPIGRAAPASEIRGAAPIVEGIAECAGSVLCTGLIARCFFTGFVQLAKQFPWRFGGRFVTTLEGHGDIVRSLAALEGGRLASGSNDRTIKVWHSTLTDISKKVYIM